MEVINRVWFVFCSIDGVKTENIHFLPERLDFILDLLTIFFYTYGILC